jgi:hypothetical protein
MTDNTEEFAKNFNILESLQEALDSGKVEPIHLSRALDLLKRKTEAFDRLSQAFYESPKAKVWYDGFESAVQQAKSVHIHVTWGPDAHPEDGITAMRNAIVSCLDQSLESAKQGFKPGKKNDGSQ